MSWGSLSRPARVELPAPCLREPGRSNHIRVTRPCHPAHMADGACGTHSQPDPVLAALLDVCLDVGSAPRTGPSPVLLGALVSSALASAVASVTGHSAIVLAHVHRCCEQSASLGFAHGAAAYSACKFERRDALMNGVERLVARFEHGRACARRRVPGQRRGCRRIGPRGQGSSRTGDAAGQSHSMRDGVLGKRSARHSWEVS